MDEIREKLEVKLGEKLSEMDGVSVNEKCDIAQEIQIIRARIKQHEETKEWISKNKSQEKK